MRRRRRAGLAAATASAMAALAVGLPAACGDSRRPAGPGDADAPGDAAGDAPIADAPSTDAPADAPIADAPADTMPDAGTAGAVPVPCAGAVIAATITTSKTDFSPEQVAIQVGEVIELAPLNPHDVMAGSVQAPKPWFFVAGNTVGCYRFDEPGALPFYCTAHPFTMNGVITVLP